MQSCPSLATFHLGGVALDLDSDDPRLIDEAVSLLGAPAPAPAPDAAPRMSARVRVPPAGAFGDLALAMPSAAHLSPADLLLAAAGGDFPFEVREADGERVALALRGEAEPALVVAGGHCRFALREGWRKAVSLLLLQRIMRCREDAIFFHAGSAAVAGAGALVVGPKGAGKSTLVLALAARGHALLGDEQAGYLPATGQLIPFLRPVGIKPGPRASAVEAALSRAGRSPERDGMMRVPLDALMDAAPAAAAPLRAVFFLDGFAPAPALRPVQPSRVDLGRLQPVGASMVNAPRTRRVFEMAALLARARVFELRAGSPDATARVVEEALATA